MNFIAFDMSQIDTTKEQYAKEVKERWGTTDAYAQSQKKTKGYSKEDWTRATGRKDEILKKFADLVGTEPESKEVQTLVGEWKDYITETYYDCTNEILAGLGQMYVADQRFSNNMDQFKEGTTELISRAIEVYCKESMKMS